ncbi:MAG: hypothetical protein M1840_004740 [Geoglossum simile]|nr:MAG: hypothetical protein M1840_004740 [Geoglossum simile]
MDQAWDPADCKPTASHLDFVPPSAACVARAYNNIRWYAGRIADAPYNPENWRERAHALFDIGYPELAIGDAYKASLLVDAGLDYGSSFGEAVRLQFGMSLWYRDSSSWDNQHSPSILIDRLLRFTQELTYDVIIHSLALLQADTDSVQVCQEALSKFPTNTFFSRCQKAGKDRLSSRRRKFNESGIPQSGVDFTLRFGRALMKPYPWIPAEYLQRSQLLLDGLSENLKTFGPKCEIRSSTVKPSPLLKIGSVEATPGNLGMFATKTIPMGGRVFLDMTPVGVTNKHTPGICGNCCGVLPTRPLSAQCCKTVVFCSPTCHRLALTHYHPALCGKDFSWLDAHAEGDPTNIPDMRPALFLRLFAMCIHQGTAHPLQLPIIARLMPAYTTDYPSSWSMHGNIVAPIQILQAFGIDVFTDLRYDTWVLQTMWWRAKNNFCGDLGSARPIVSINPFYSFVNHSCEPNVYWNSKNSTVDLKAIRRIRKGEEILTSYLSHNRMTKAERAVQLNQWLGKCGCARCLRES